MSEQRQPTQELKKLKEILEIDNLIIPSYQRPYKWQSQHVIQLLDDIFEHIIIKKKVYRIGSLILHEEGNNIQNIVDGQQRLTTISILLKAVGRKDLLLHNQEYKHKDSKDNIVYNYRIVQNWLHK